MSIDWSKKPRGVYCRHEKRIMVPKDEADQYSGFKFADPYPCDNEECTPERVSKEFEDEEDEYRAAQWDEFYRLTYGS